MALFDFLKKKKDKEKEARKSASASEKSEKKEKSKDKMATGAGRKEENVYEKYKEDMVLVAPHITEKSRFASEAGGYVFRVLPEADKRTVKNSVEHFYHVDVDRVRIIHIPGKPRKRGLTSGSKKGYKKAIVILREGQKIDMF